MLKELKDIIIEAEKQRPTLVLNPLPYSRDELEPVMSKESIDLHYKSIDLHNIHLLFFLSFIVSIMVLSISFTFLY